MITFDFPAGRVADSPHGYTLKAVLEACLPDDPSDMYEWAVPAMEARLSIPEDGIERNEKWIERITVLELKRKTK